jgi:hypothetical protein
MIMLSSLFIVVTAGLLLSQTGMYYFPKRGCKDKNSFSEFKKEINICFFFRKTDGRKIV